MHGRLAVGDLLVDLSARSVTRHGEPLELKGLTFDLFAALIGAEGEALSLQDLADNVWRGEPVSNEVITQRVRLLRRALDDDPNEPRYVETRRQSGYRLCARVTELTPASADGASRKRGLWHWVVVGVLAAVFLAGLIGRGRTTLPVDPLVERARAYAATGQEDDNRRAIDLFEQKLEASPDHYGASLGLSFAYAQRVCRHDDVPSFATRARALAQKLVERDPQDADALAALAYADDCAGRIDEALDGYLRAHALDGSRLAAIASAAHLMEVKGDLADALSHNLSVEAQTLDRPFRYIDIQIARCLELMTFRRAASARYARTVQLYPDNLFAAASYVRFLLSDGQSEAGVAAAERAHRLGAGSTELYSYWGELLLKLRQPDAALEKFEMATASTRSDTWAKTLLEAMRANGQANPELVARVATLQDAVERGNLWPRAQLEMALLHWHAGQTVEAMSALDAAVTHGFRDAAYLKASPFFAPLISTQEGASVVRRIEAAASDQRDRALAADWWRPSLIDPDAL